LESSSIGDGVRWHTTQNVSQCSMIKCIHTYIYIYIDLKKYIYTYLCSYTICDYVCIFTFIYIIQVHGILRLHDFFLVIQCEIWLRVRGLMISKWRPISRQAQLSRAAGCQPIICVNKKWHDNTVDWTVGKLVFLANSRFTCNKVKPCTLNHVRFPSKAHHFFVVPGAI